MFFAWTPEVIEAMNRGREWQARNPQASNLKEWERCCNWMAPECTGVANDSGWCDGCSASLFPEKAGR